MALSAALFVAFLVALFVALLWLAQAFGGEAKAISFGGTGWMAATRGGRVESAVERALGKVQVPLFSLDGRVGAACEVAGADKGGERGCPSV